MHYAFEVFNEGTVSVSEITVDDPMLADAGISVDCPTGTVLPGFSVTCTASYEVTQADVDLGEVANVATASGVPAAGLPGVDSAPDTTSTPTDTRDVLSLVKTAALVDGDGDGLADAGETIDYTFEVTNAGTTTLSDVLVDDPMLAEAGNDVTCPAVPGAARVAR